VRYRESVHTMFPAVNDRVDAFTWTVNGTRNLGYLADFSLPFSTELIVSLTENHDQNRYAVTVYALSPAASIPLQAMRAAGARVVLLAAIDERFAAERIRADNLDLLIDVSGGGAYSKPGLLSQRPVRVQISLPGLTRATGIGDLDGRITDPVLDMGGSSDAIAIEPWLVQGCAIPVVPLGPVDGGLARNNLGLSQEVCVFGILATAEHISMRCLTLWKAIAERVPDAMFLVRPLDARDILPIKRMLLNARIAAERILTLPPTFPQIQELALAGAIDVILDALPGSDYYSAITSLREGIPLVTMPGKIPEERIALALMTHVGESSTIAASGRDYVDFAARLAQDYLERNQLSARLQSAWEKSSTEGGHLSMRSYTLRLERAIDTAGARLEETRTTTALESPP
jgi:predicted O-linked N-acetylglucosamine transferase (SPINDLY family)